MNALSLRCFAVLVNAPAIPIHPTMAARELSPQAWDRMVSAVEKVRRRLLRATQALEQAEVPYAVAGSSAVAARIREVDESATRNTPDIDILLRRADLERAKDALTTAGFSYRNSQSGELFLDSPDAKARDAVRIIFAGEKVREDHTLAAPDVEESTATSIARVLSVEALVNMSLTSFRLDDRVDLRDMIDVGLVDQSWVDRLPKELSSRLQQLLDTPEG